MLSSNGTHTNTCLKINEYISQLYMENAITQNQLSDLADKNLKALRSHDYKDLLNSVAEIYQKTDSFAAGEILSLIYGEITTE